MSTLNVHRMVELEQSVFPLMTAQIWNCSVDGTAMSGCPLQVFCCPTFRQNALWTVKVAPLSVTVPATFGCRLEPADLVALCLVDACFAPGVECRAWVGIG